MARNYLPYTLDQRLLLPPDMREWLPEGHLALFIADIVSELDLSAIEGVYEAKDDRGRAGFNPRMMVALLLYAYCVGKPSSRKIERATYEDVAFRVLSGDQHPDHDCIASFRKEHLAALAELFTQGLKLCREAGLVKLGHIAIDGSKFKANASKHKAMSYERMGEAEKRLEQEVAELLGRAEQVDGQEDAEHGKGQRGDELPKELARRESRLAKIRAAKAALEADAKAKAAEKAKTKQPDADDSQTGSGSPSPQASASSPCEDAKPIPKAPSPCEDAKPIPKAPSPCEEAKPDSKAQRNFTDPESRIMPDGANKGAFVQAYNAQIAVDAKAQIIVAFEVTQKANDVCELVPMAESVVANMGQLAETTSADAGYFSKENVEHPVFATTNLLVPPSRQKHGQAPLPGSDEPSASPAERMRHKLASDSGRALYKMRKAIVEAVFGQIKMVRGLRQFLMRGHAAARGEFALMALTHNLLKLYRSGVRAFGPVAA
jgi:transposase